MLRFLLCLAPNASLTAQETLRENNGEPTLVERLSNGEIKINSAEMNFQLFTSANAEFVGKELDGMNFKLNRVRLEIKGDVGKWLGYHYRQSFNKYSDPYSLDNLSSSLELAYVNLKARHNLNFTIGKQFVNFGGYEYYVNSIRVREFSEFNNLLTAYQAGISGNWQVNPDHELCFQIVNNRNGNDEDIYPTGLPEGTAKAKIPFMYTVNWNSYYLDKTLQLRYATAVGQQTRKRYSYYFTCGNTYEKGPLLTYLDVMYTRQGIDQHGVVSRLPGTPHTAMNTEYLSIIGDVEKKTKIMTAEEKRTIALHEAGHATLSWFLEHANPLIKVTIVPRGRALGAAWYLPEERQITTKEQMLDEMCATLGGRAAEELFTGHISTGAMNDLERVTKQSYGMIAYAGMSEKLPNLCYYSNDEYSFSKPYSERTAELIDEEVKRMINEQYDRAKAILSEHKDGHNELARLLVEKEVIFAEDVERIFGKRPWTSRSEEIMALEATAKPVEVTEDFEEKNSSDSEEKEKEKKEA